MKVLEQFIKEEQEDTIYWLDIKRCLMKHDVKLVNFILSEVEKEWYKAKKETFTGQNEAENAIESILNKFKI